MKLLVIKKKKLVNLQEVIVVHNMMYFQLINNINKRLKIKKQIIKILMDNKNQ